MTAIKAPVASLRISFSLSATPTMPAGVEKRPPPRDTRPVALIRRRCPLRTTSPLFVQPLFALSARTGTLIVKNVAAPVEEGGVVFVRGGILLLSGCGFDLAGCET